MVAGGAIRAVGCSYCRTAALWSFVALQRHAIRRPGIQFVSPSFIPSTFKSPFSSRATDNHARQNVIEETSEILTEEEEQPNKPDNAETSTSESSSIPWYLQVNSPKKEAEPLSDRQRIPELPQSPPPILEPLLRQISIDLGLDDLTLLDLRNLDPPPALGAEVLMIVGTARSEKHLHVSADRLCRWLRSTYKLRPDADGLLGRNELKLKLRRKNRRAKLLGTGASEDNGDDGVRTGWVCVNVGTVDGGDKPSPVTKEKGFVGFGRHRNSVKIVVQMMIQEKREELNLEELWGGIIRRGSPIEPEEESAEVNSGASPITTKPHSPMSGQTRPSLEPNTRSTGFPGSRALHTSAHRLSVGGEQFARVKGGLSSCANPLLETHTSDLVMLRGRVMQALVCKDYEGAKTLVIDNADSIRDTEWNRFLLLQLRAYLQSIPKEEALTTLGDGVDDYESTPFLKFFHSLMSRFPGEFEWQERVWLSCFAHELGHSGYTVAVLIDLFNQLQASGVEVGRNVYLNFMRSLLGSDEREPEAYPIKEGDLVPVVQILQTLYERGINILTEDLLVPLQLSLLDRSDLPKGTFVDPNTTFELPSLKLTSISKRVHSVLTMVSLERSNDVLRSKLLHSYAKQQYWEAFWDYWRSFARHREPRSPALYATMFQCVAASNNQRACLKVLRTWVPEMELESPMVVPEGPVLDAIQVCVKVAHSSDTEESLGQHLGDRAVIL